MKKEVRFLLSALLFLGGISLIRDAEVLTGAFLGTGVLSASTSLLGWGFIVASMMVFAFGSGKDLEERIKIYEVHRRKRRFVEVSGMGEIAGELIQLNHADPIDGMHINLDELKDLLGEAYLSQEGREEIVHKYEPSVREQIIKAQREYIEGTLRMRKGKMTKKELVSDLEYARKQLRIAEAGEELMGVLRSKYVPRKKKLRVSAESHHERYILNPLRRGTAAYVHFTSKENAEVIEEKRVVRGEAQALYFPSLEKAREFVKRMNRGLVESITGARNAEQAIIFQTVNLPRGLSQLVGKKSGSMWRAYFEGDLPLDSCYTFERKGLPKK